MSGRAEILDGVITIRIPVENLTPIIEGAWATGNLMGRLRLTNSSEFALDLLRELNRESEDGSTPIHRLFDKCIYEAVDQGAQGIEFHPTQNF